MTSSGSSRCIAFSSRSLPHTVSFCPPKYHTATDDTAAYDYTRNATLVGDDDDKTWWYVCLDSFQITLNISSDKQEALSNQLIEHTSAVLCITIRDKGSTPQSTFEAVYPQNIIPDAVTGGFPNRDAVQDTILHEQAFTLGAHIYADLERASLPITYLTIHNNGIKHPVFYALPPIPTLDENDTHTVQISAYIKAPHTSGGSDANRRFYLPLFDTKTNNPIEEVRQFSAKLLFCNETYLKEHDLGPYGSSDATIMSEIENGFNQQYLLGTVNTIDTTSTTSEYPFKVDFKNAALDPSQSVRREDLQLDPTLDWEMAVSRVTYTLSDDSLIKIPSPESAKLAGIYDLYSGEIMVGPSMYFPMVSDADMNGRNMSDCMTKVYNITSSDMLTYFDENFQRLWKMNKDLRDCMTDGKTPTPTDEWYWYDLMETFSAGGRGARCPVFRWNYLDLLKAKYPVKFQLYGDNYAMLSLREVLGSHTNPMSKAEEANAQKWLEAGKISGYHWRYTIVGMSDWYNVMYALPIFTLLDHTNQSTDADIRDYSLKIQPKYATVYVAVGSIMSKMMGYTPVCKTRKLVNPTTKLTERRALDVIYSNVRESYISPCQMASRTATLAPVAPRPYTHNSLVPTPGPHSIAYPWSLPKLEVYSDSSLNYYYLPNTPKAVYSNTKLNVLNADDIFIYTNVLPNVAHIANHLSPLLVQIPCPVHMFGQSRFDIPYSLIGGGNNKRIMSTRTWDIKNLQYHTLNPGGVNLDDMQVSVANSYGDLICPGVLDLQLIVREKIPTATE